VVALWFRERRNRFAVFVFFDPQTLRHVAALQSRGAVSGTASEWPVLAISRQCDLPHIQIRKRLRP